MYDIQSCQHDYVMAHMVYSLINMTVMAHMIYSLVNMTV